jgi:GeoRSP system PqqD family protein
MNWIESIPVQSTDTAWRVVDGECIIITPPKSRATVLNTVGSRIWELCDGKNSTGEIVEKLLDEYNVERDVLVQDVKEFLDTMAQKELILYREKQK